MIIKLTYKKRAYYLVWSAIVDAPVTNGLTLDELKAYWENEHGRIGLAYIERMLPVVEQRGFSVGTINSLNELFSGNRAGEGGKELSRLSIIKKYCLQPNYD